MAELDIETTNRLISEIKSEHLSGFGAAARLFQEGLDISVAEKILREDLGFYVLVDPSNKSIMTVSVEQYDGGPHPRVKDFVWVPKEDQVWLSEVE